MIDVVMNSSQTTPTFYALFIPGENPAIYSCIMSSALPRLNLKWDVHIANSNAGKTEIADDPCGESVDWTAWSKLA